MPKSVIPTAAPDGQQAVPPAGLQPEQQENPRACIHPDRSLGWLRRLWPLVAAHRTLVIVGITGGLLALAIQVAVPAAARVAIDIASDADTSTTRSLTGVIWLLVGLAVGRVLFSGVYRYSLFKLAFRIDTELRSLIYSHLGTLSFSYYDRTQSGDVISRANSDIRSIQIFFSFAPIAIISVLTFVFAFTLMLTIHIPLAIVTMCSLPAVHHLGMRFRKTVFPLSWITQARTAEVAAIVDENVGGTRVVKSFAAEKNQIRLLSKAAQRLQWAATATVQARARFNPVIEALPRVSMVLVLLYGGWLAIDGQVSVGTLFAFNAYVIMLQLPFRLIGFLLTQSQRAAASAKRIYEVLDEQPEISEKPGAVDLQTGQQKYNTQGDVSPTNSTQKSGIQKSGIQETGIQKSGNAVRFENVRFFYPRRSREATEPASDVALPDNSLSNAMPPDAMLQDTCRESPEVLRGLNLHIQSGETVALVGSTSSGKSTVARLIARFYDAQQGAVLINNTDVRDLRLASLRAGVGIAFDEPFLFSETLADNIAFGKPDATRQEIIEAATAAEAHGFITELPKGYDTVVGERGYTLSGGQRQRVALARVLLEKPEILILDDATSAVDVQVEARIHKALRKYLEGRTTILISHRISTIQLAERVLLLQDGVIADEGTHAELLAGNTHYAKILADVNTPARGVDS